MVFRDTDNFKKFSPAREQQFRRWFKETVSNADKTGELRRLQKQNRYATLKNDKELSKLVRRDFNALVDYISDSSYSDIGDVIEYNRSNNTPEYTENFLVDLIL